MASFILTPIRRESLNYRERFTVVSTGQIRFKNIVELYSCLKPKRLLAGLQNNADISAALRHRTTGASHVFTSTNE